MRRRCGRMTAMAAAMAAAGLATAAQAGPVRPGEMLGLFGPDVPAALQKAHADPYMAPAQPACQSVPAEIDGLNAALGPDADQAPLKTDRVGKLAIGAVRGLIPHRDVIRFLTQANKKDDALKQAALAGWARRGYLKGLATTLDCPSTTVAAAESAARPAAAVEVAPFDAAVGQPPQDLPLTSR